MFYSLGDLIVNKHNAENEKHPKHYHWPEDLEKYNLKNENLLSFAIGERGWYFMNLGEENHGQLYFCNYSGGDGIVQIETRSFSFFINSLGFPEWDEEGYDNSYRKNVDSYIPNKVAQPKYFHTPSNPKVGLNHFVNCYSYFIEKNPPENRLKYLARAYANFRDITTFLIDQGHDPKQLLLGTGLNIDSIKFIVNDLGININESFEGRYPIHSLLTPRSTADLKVRYQLIHDLIDSGIEVDWSVIGVQFHDGDNITALERLKSLNKKYRAYEQEELERYGDNGLPHGSTPFFHSNYIESIINGKSKSSWKSRFMNRITRGNNK